MTRLEQIRIHELNKLTRSIQALIPVRPDSSKPLVFQCKDALDAGIISRFEAREVLKHNQQPHRFPCFAEKKAA